jgi:hypothetical protein
MVKKIVHGIETCEDCKKIYFLLFEPEPSSIRFNALRDLCRKTIDPKYSPPRLNRHLKGMEGKFVKNTKKGSQKSVYSPIIPRVDRDLARLDLEERTEKLCRLRLDQLIDLTMNLYKFTGLEQLIGDMESRLNIHTPQEYSAKMTFIKIHLSLKMNQYTFAMKNRSKTEYAEALKKLKDEREQLTKRLS